jgi:hypothetical protein
MRVAAAYRDIVLGPRSFTEVHELVYLFHSWQLVLEAETIPDPLRPLKEMPEHLIPVMIKALGDAQLQLESAQAGTQISLRFEASPGFAELMRWGADHLDRIIAPAAGEDLHENWQRALRLAKELVSSILEQVEGAGAAPVMEEPLA